MTLFIGFLVVVLTGGYQCDCTQINSSINNGFNPVKCLLFPNTYSYCFNNNFNFDNYFNTFEDVYILQNMEFTNIGFYNWQNINTTTLFENVSLAISSPLHFNKTLNIESGAVINVINNKPIFGLFSEAGNLNLTNPELNKPRIISWNSTYIHLHRHYNGRLDFQILNPISGAKCFDVFSLNNQSNLDIGTRPDHISSAMFEYSYNFTDGKGYLISNKKLIRFCPNGTQLDTNVICTLKKEMYTNDSPTTMEGAFDYPHCPCNSDSTVNCKLKFSEMFDLYNMYNFDISNTELLVNRDIKVTNLKRVKQLTINNDTKLDISAHFDNTIFSFSFGVLTNGVYEDKYITDASLQYHTSSSTLECIGNFNYSISLVKEIRYFQIECPSTIEVLNLYEKTSVVILQNTSLYQINKIQFGLYGTSYTVMDNPSNNKIHKGCILIELTKDKTICLLCGENYQLLEGECLPIDEKCQIWNLNGICTMCVNNYVLDDDHECISSDNCSIGTTTECYKCRNNYIRNNNNCYKENKCVLSNEYLCLHCSAGNTEANCEKCVDINCQLCESEKCILCNMGFVINSVGICEIQHNGLTVGVSTIWCNGTFYIENESCNSCSLKYEHSHLCDKTHVVSCQPNYKQNDYGLCIAIMCTNTTTIDQNGLCQTDINSCVFIVNNKCVECENTSILNNNKSCAETSHNNNSTNCISFNKNGCISCAIGYYLSNTECNLCSENCTSCVESDTKCLSCKSGFYQGENYSCLPSTDLLSKCNKISTITNGCYQCKDGYYRVGLNCFECLLNCSTCNTKDKCLTCNSTNYKTLSGNCLPQNSVVGCAVKVTQYGCDKCIDGYYKVNYNECERCHDNCTICTQPEKCTSCFENMVLYENGLCYDISFVSNCVAVSNSKCSRCTFWHSTNGNGTLCDKKAVWWVLLIVVLFAIIVMAVVITSIVFVVYFIEKKIRQKKIEMTATLFKMSRSNITFVSLDDDVVVNKTEISFGQDVDVNAQQRELLCVGNTSKHNMKIQITTKGATIEKYVFESNPKIVMLPSGEACEFEILLTLKCTTRMDES
ncbi:protein kinase domain containing protein, partial [Entamoeba invadens IP1]